MFILLVPTETVSKLVGSLLRILQYDKQEMFFQLRRNSILSYLSHNGTTYSLG